MYKFNKFVKLTDKLILNHAAPLITIYNFQSKIINTQIRTKTSLINSRFSIHTNPNSKKNNSLISIKNSFRINFIIQQKRFFNEDTNASSVWDPYPGLTQQKKLLR